MAAKLNLKSGWDETGWRQLSRRIIQTGSGRGHVTLVAHPKGMLLERQYLRGGVRRLFFPKIFLRTSRPEREFRIHQHLLEKGVSTVEPVGWRERPVAPPLLYQYFYYSRYIEGAVPLPRFWRSHRLTHGHLAQMADILHGLFRARVYHTDLNLNNWLVQGQKVFIIDFDQAVGVDRTPLAYLATCLYRTVRSARKLGMPKDRRLFFRLLILAARRFGVSTRDVLARIPRGVYKKRFYHPWLWKLSGGHQQVG